jgi:Intracellular proteinase inhibitor
VAIVAFVFAFRGGSNGGGAGNPAGAGSSVVLTVDQALAAEEGQTIHVQGALLISGGRTLLASALSESNPPQASGASLPLKGLNPSALVGLNTTAGQAGVAEATWSNYQLVLQGVIRGGVLTVQSTPRVEEDTSVAGLRLRFSPVSEPISSGDQAWWAFDATNTGQADIQLIFSDGQQADVILSQGGTDKYTWSAGKAFTQVVQTVTLAPGKSLPIVLSDTLNVPAGTYDVTARVTAMLGPSGSEVPLPDITSTLTID